MGCYFAVSVCSSFFFGEPPSFFAYAEGSAAEGSAV
jgi:hypothetical protein